MHGQWLWLWACLLRLLASGPARALALLAALLVALLRGGAAAAALAVPPVASLERLV